MLIALVNNEPGLKRAAALALLAVIGLFTGGLFGAQFAAPQKFGCSWFYGTDLVSIYSAGRLVVSGQGGDVYDPARRKEASASLTGEMGSDCEAQEPAAYWLGFLLPILPFTFLPVKLAYYLWTALSVALFLFALMRLARANGASRWKFWLIGLAFFPVPLGLFQGQLHGWQFMAITEFWLALRHRADRAGGLWLSVQLMKFNFLPLVVLYLLWHGRWRMLVWFVVGALFWVGLSTMLSGGLDGISSYLLLYRDRFAPIDAKVGVAVMTNWRALAFVWSGASASMVVTGVTIVLTLLTCGLVVWSWLRWRAETAQLEARPFLGLMSAAVLAGYSTLPYSDVLLLAPALVMLCNLRGASGALARLWSILLDFSLLAPSLMLPLLTPALIPTAMPWLVAGNQIFLFALIEIFLASVLLAIRTTWTMQVNKLAATPSSPS